MTFDPDYKEQKNQNILCHGDVYVEWLNSN
jgi:hypothetical protein